MNRFAIIALCVMFWHGGAAAQKADNQTQQSAVREIGVIGAVAGRFEPEYVPPSASERLRQYVTSTFGPGAVLRATAAAGIGQWQGTPKEWGGGPEALGDRVGNSFAKHVIRKTLEFGAAAALHDDNRYVFSTDTGFWLRTKHVIASVFTARDEAGHKHFAYSRFGGAVGASFISRIWQPNSEDTSGDAAVSFGLSIAADMGWNLIKEFRPHRSPRY